MATTTPNSAAPTIHSTRRRRRWPSSISATPISDHATDSAAWVSLDAYSASTFHATPAQWWQVRSTMPVTSPNAVTPSTAGSTVGGMRSRHAAGSARTQPTMASSATPAPISSGLSSGTHGSGAALPALVLATHSQPNRQTARAPQPMCSQVFHAAPAFQR